MPDQKPLPERWSEIVRHMSVSEDLMPADLGFANLAKPLGIWDRTLLLAVPSETVKDRLETRMNVAFQKTLIALRADDIDRYAVTIDSSLPTTVGLPEDQERPGLHLVRDDDGAASPSPSPHLPTPKEADPSRLNPRYTFETFVIGSSNRFANAAARAVAEAPARAYNPLFIYGGSGLGKTHLLHAIGHYARTLQPGSRVRYVSSEEFTNEFINSIRDDKAQAFQRRYRNVDVLLVDDIQFLGGKEQTQEEFFHTFNSLHNADKQVVVSSDTTPKKLQGFEERLTSRFESGLLTDVQPPDLETRIAILRKKAMAEKLPVNDEVMTYIASRISTNIRELEGALIRVTAFANLNRQPVELSLAEIVLRDLVTDTHVEEITPALILSETSEYFSVTVEALCSPDRSRPISDIRQIAMYLCRELTDLSLPKIGQTFGGRDHTTVIYGCRKITEQMAEKRATYNQVTDLINRIKLRAHNAS